jgi:hypothetical protein
MKRHAADLAGSRRNPIVVPGMKPNRSIPAAAIVPVLIYPDVREAVGWLCGTFGLSRGCGSYRAQLWFGDGAIIVADVRRDRRPGEVTHSVMVRADVVGGGKSVAPVGHGRSLREQGRDQMNRHTRATEHRRPPTCRNHSLQAGERGEAHAARQPNSRRGSRRSIFRKPPSSDSVLRRDHQAIERRAPERRHEAIRQSALERERHERTRIQQSCGRTCLSSGDR